MPSPESNRRHHPVSLQQAAEEAPALARLAALVRESSQRLETVRGLIPPLLRPAVRPGPVEGDSWCLLVNGNAAAAKLRQLLPSLLARLRAEGCQVETIRIKVNTDWH